MTEHDRFIEKSMKEMELFTILALYPISTDEAKQRVGEYIKENKMGMS